MQERIMEIIVGREAQKTEPRLALTCEGHTLFMGNPGCVSKHMSRKHCRIELNKDNTVSVYDITDDNFIYVNGVECKSKKNIPLNSCVELGSDRYLLDLQMIISAFAAKQSYSIVHLEKVYDDFVKFKFDYQVRQNRIGIWSSLPMGFSMLSGAIATWCENVRGPMGVVAAVTFFYFLFARYKAARKGPQELRYREDKFHEEYVCPNPACQHYLGTMKYKELAKIGYCPHCKARFEK